MPQPSITTSTLLVRFRAQIQQAERTAVLQVLSADTSQTGDPALTRLANTFTRYAQTQATVYDTSPSATPAAAGASLLERQVDRALTQVLGRGTGRGSNSFIAALNGTFPFTADGQVQFSPARGAVAMYGSSYASITDGYSGNGYAPARLSAGLIGQLSAEQAALYRETSIVAADALQILAGLQPFVPQAEPDKVEALRALVSAEINTLIEEVGRTDEPRFDRLESYLAALEGPNGSLAKFGDRAFLNRSIAAVTPDDEAMIAGFELLTNYVGLLGTAFRRYFDRKKDRPKSLDFPEFSLRLQRASVMLSVVSDGTNNFMLAMDAVGFTERERRSQSAKLSSLVDPKLLPTKGRQGLRDITVGDLTDELDKVSNVDGPAYLADSGQYGLGLLTDQAHRLFLLIAPIFAHLQDVAVNNQKVSPLGQVLIHERVNWALDDLFRQLDVLAGLAA